MAQRYQREIEEILDKKNEESEEAGSGKSSGPRRRSRTKRNQKPRYRRGFSLRLTPGSMAVAGVAFLLAALVFGAQPLLWVGIALFVVAYVRFFTKPRRTIERRWRGQSIEDDPAPSFIQRLWGWFTRG